MKKSNILKSTVIVLFITIISKLIGAFRDILISYKFGASINTDAYKLAISIPEVIFAIVGLAISTAFIPMLSKVRAEEGQEKMNKFANNIINILLLISVIIFIVSIIFPDKIVGIVASKNMNIDTINITIKLTKIVLINILFLAINACFVAILQVNEDFIVPTILGLFFNLPMILYMLFMPNFNIYGLTIANVVGNIFRVIVQIPSLRRNGYRYSFIFNLRDVRVKKFFLIIIPVIIGASANSINLIVDKKIASSLGNGVVTTLDNAQILINMITTLALTAISSVIYPVLVNKINNKDGKSFSELISKTLVCLGIILIPISLGALIYGKSIINIVYLRGEYTTEGANLTSLAFIGYALGIFFIAIRDLLNSSLFSMGKTKITARNGVIGVVVNIILSIYLSKLYGIIGIAIASSIAMVITSILLLISIIKLEGNFNYKKVGKSIGKIIIAALFMTIIILILNTFMKGYNEYLTLFLGVAIGALFYFVLIYLFKVEEVTELLNVVRRRRE